MEYCLPNNHLDTRNSTHIDLGFSRLDSGRQLFAMLSKRCRNTQFSSAFNQFLEAAL